MAEKTIRIEGLDELRAAFKRSPEIARKFIDEAIRKSILTIQAKSVPFTPKDTGFLKGSYTSSFGELIGELEVSAPYALFVHDGTRFMKGRPYLDDGIDASQIIVQAFFDSALDNITNELAK